jgi:hypothetical protein
MALVKSVEELQTDARNYTEGADPTLTDWSEGSILDILTGMVATAVAEVQRVAVNEFRKTFIESANGPEVTGGDDELQTLLVDHFGDSFARPAAQPAEGVVTFSRANTGAGNCVIPSGTIVKTAPDASGVAQRFATVSTVTMTGLSISASVAAVVAGAAGNVASAACNVIESTLTDSSVVVTNASAFTGGADVYDDATYREYARNLIVSNRGGTLSAIVAKAKTVSGVVTVVGTEEARTVRLWSVASGAASGDPFYVTYCHLYIADANGSADDALIASVKDAIDDVSAAGVQILVEGATAITVNVTIHLTLNAGGPNYPTLASDPQLILDDINAYINALDIGDDLIVADLRTYILALWGAAGSNDLTNMTISVPSGDVATTSTEKLVPGTITVA